MPAEEPYEIVIGLEVHAQLLTGTKLFCGDTTSFGQEPNTQVSAISLGHPGTLPRLNQKAIALAVRLGLACHCEIVQHNYFARKNYFYPDLPKGYQISQHTTPVCRNGYLDVEVPSGARKVRINRIHMEEDAGKSIHDGDSSYSQLDYNRAGIPLLEIVTEPDLRSAAEAAAFVTLLRRMVRYLGVCDGNMEQGSFRCDVNISARKSGDERLGTKVEVKNLNSIRFIRKAIEHESSRLIEMLRNGELILQQTRGFRESDFTTYAIRTKEDEDDYRYFPEPDLPPFYISSEFISEIRSNLPPSPDAIRDRLTEEFQLSAYDAAQIAGDMELTELFLEVCRGTRNYKGVANWLTSPLKKLLENAEATATEAGVSAGSILQLLQLVEAEKISNGVAVQKLLPQLVADPQLDIIAFIEEHQLYLTTSGDELEAWIDQALQKHSQKITEFKKGKKGLISLFVGEVMKLSGGKADARTVTDKLLQKINQS